MREPFTIKIDGANDQPNVGDSVNFICSVPGGSNYGNPIWLDVGGNLIVDQDEGKSIIGCIGLSSNYGNPIWLDDCRPGLR